MDERVKIIQLSDIHLSAKGEEAVQADRLFTAVNVIRECYRDCDLVVITGDIADDGKETSYQIARDILSDIEAPLVTLVGNHDRREALRNTVGNAPNDGSGFVQTRILLGPAEVLALDTLDEGREAGLLCPRRMTWLTEQTNRPNAQIRLVFMHHPPLPIGVSWLDAIKLQNHKAVISALSSSSVRTAVFAGHVHMDTVISQDDLTMFTTRGLARGFGMHANHTDNSPPGFRVIEVGEDGTLIVRTEHISDSA